MGEILKAIQGLATVAIAIYVALVGTMQWRTAQEKLRLELYEKRFDVYVRASLFMEILLKWNDMRPEYVERRDANPRAFFRAFQESRFLFGKDSEPFRILKELTERSVHIMYFEDHFSGNALYTDDAETNRQLQKNKAESSTWIFGCGDRLADAMAKYLDFHQLQARFNSN